MTRPHPTVIEHLMIGGLHSEIVATFRDRHRRREPCRCALCEGGGIREPEPTPEPGQLGAWDDEVTT